MTYETERTPRTPTGSPTPPEQPPVTAGQPPVTSGRTSERAPVTTDRTTEPSPVTTDRTTGKSPADPDRVAGQSPKSPERPAGRPSVSAGPSADAAAAADRPLFPEGDQEKLAQRLQQAVTEFVENPVRAVEEAEGAFDAAVDSLANALKERRREMGAQQQGGESGTRTEELRIVLQQYRDLTERLLKA
ncbi:hypothetical protein [Streptomyces sp. NPDC048462]|uniref:hypothetical protein n=1 Tax=Streptomyces sp. NPDC048462 TaxID=3365555 RepID=UPI00370F956D